MLQPKTEHIGKLDKWLRIQSKIVGVNESNEDEEAGWEDVVTCWGSIEDRQVSSGEEYRADQLTSFQNSTIVIRYRTDVTTKNRILSEGEIYNILTIAKVGRKRFLSLSTETGGQYQES